MLRSCNLFVGKMVEYYQRTQSVCRRILHMAWASTRHCFTWKRTVPRRSHDATVTREGLQTVRAGI